MPPAVFSTTSISELESFMVETLCNHEKLDVQQAMVKRSLIRTGSSPVGLVVRLQGPRQMRSHAIWAERESRILFYDSAGHRFAIVRLAEMPDLVSNIIV